MNIEKLVTIVLLVGTLWAQLCRDGETVTVKEISLSDVRSSCNFRANSDYLRNGYMPVDQITPPNEIVSRIFFSQYSICYWCRRGNAANISEQVPVVFCGFNLHATMCWNSIPDRLLWRCCFQHVFWSAALQVHRNKYVSIHVWHKELVCFGIHNCW